ncbi:MAG: multicopper oxidase domain-containing protein [Candidatus Nitrosotenuis sp.]|nr:multicopper oxidase domain-containing protein [Candidatus Nitrosotenuis uzonensis]
MLFSVTAVAVLAATLFGSTYTQSQIVGSTMAAKSSDDLISKIHDMGGLKLVMPQAFAAVDCGNIEEGRNVVEFNLTGESADLPVIGGGTYKAMTFSGQVPGPTLRVTQGDVVMMTLTIPSDELTPHGNDMHASEMSAGNFGKVLPGQSHTYCYVAQVPGTFKYHCSGVDVAAMDQHVLSGMYGITIVDPLNGYAPLVVDKTTVKNGQVVKDRQVYPADALEFQLQYNQLYLTDAGGYDQGKMFKHETTWTVVNGMSFGYVPNAAHNELIMGDAKKNIFVAQPWNSPDLKQYQSQLLFIEEGQKVRFFIENQGNEPVFFHIVGEIIDRVVQANVVQAKGTETWLVGGSQGMIADVVFDEPGVYVAVNHDYAAIFTGAASVMVVGDPFNLNQQLGTNAKSYAELLGNPSDAIPPMGKNSIAHPKVNLHGLYTDERANELKAELGL